MFTDLVAILTVIALIYVISRINKSNTLFWTLITVLMISLVGGAIGGKILSDLSKKSVNVQTTLTQGSSSATYSAADDTFALVGKASIQAKLVGQEVFVPYLKELTEQAPSELACFTRAGPQQFPDTS